MPPVPEVRDVPICGSLSLLMTPSENQLEHLDGPLLGRLMVAGVRHLFGRREYINRINVFPVPDGDTGTNMAFTFKSILDAIEGSDDLGLIEVMDRLTDAALDGARGNSGAIMAQFFQGCREAVQGQNQLDATGLASACRRGAEQAWTAMSEPVAGTLPTVLEDFARVLSESAGAGVTDLRSQFTSGLDAARASLENTPNLLPVLKQAGVVDAGAQGFVDLLDGIHAFVDEGVIDPLDEATAALVAEDPDSQADLAGMDVGGHRFCTECVVEGKDLERKQVMKRLQALDQSSLVVAGSPERVRVHIHVNNPAEVFLACEAFGEITQQKADDMQRQHGLMNQPGQVAIVTDSGADLPESEVERLGIHIVPVRVSIGGREFLDGVSLKPEAFYRMLSETEQSPQTSQPPPGDFRRVFEMLTGHGYDVMTVGLSTRLSGTTQSAMSAAGRVEQGRVSVFDTLNASCGQGLLAMVAAEAAAAGSSLDEIEKLLEKLSPQTHTLAIPDELSSAVRGGRVPAWLGRLAGLLHVTPVMMAKEGKMAIAGIAPGRGADAGRLAKRVLKKMRDDESYRVLIAHAANPEGAREVRRLILERHAIIHSCLLAEAGPALGAHLGKGGLIAGFLPHL